MAQGRGGRKRIMSPELNEAQWKHGQNLKTWLLARLAKTPSSPGAKRMRKNIKQLEAQQAECVRRATATNEERH